MKLQQVIWRSKEKKCLDHGEFGGTSSGIKAITDYGKRPCPAVGAGQGGKLIL
jgi:hypothetical protein